MENIILKVGNLYENRQGDKIKIVEFSEAKNLNFPFFGTKNNQTYSFDEKGNYLKSKDHVYDLIKLSK